MLAVMMILTLAAPIFADGEETGSITINGVSADVTYKIYRLLDLESYDPTSGAYSYKINSDWDNFFGTETAKAYMTVDDQGYATWIAAEDDDTVARFAKRALEYAKGELQVRQDDYLVFKDSNDVQYYYNEITTEHGVTKYYYTYDESTNEYTKAESVPAALTPVYYENSVIDPVKSSATEGNFVISGNSGVFSDLPLGYYLVDSTVGALCGLTTTNPNASVNAKNGHPTIDKQVKEDSTNQWGDSNTADIGQTVEFRTTINVHAGAENYILHDIMSAGLTFDSNSVKIEHVIPNVSTHIVSDSDYEVKVEDLHDDACTFEVVFSKELCERLEMNDKLIVYYSAMLNRNAIVASDGNPNETWLKYGENNDTTHDSTTTKTYRFDIVKTDSQNTLIDGAEFKIYDAATDGNEVAVVLMDDGVTYRRARADETGTSIVVENGKVRVVGFDNGTYYLEETVAPVGYNKLAGRQKFIISDGNLDATFNGEIYSTGSGVHVVNKTGTMLPETGGLGTTLFVVFGSIAVLGSGVVLFAKKRLDQYED